MFRHDAALLWTAWAASFGAACVEDTAGGFDAEVLGRVDAAPQSARDGSVGEDARALPPPPRSSLEGVVDAAAGVLRGSVTTTRPGARTYELQAAGYTWRITHDLVVVSTTHSLGVARTPSMDIYLLPSSCEAFNAEGERVPDAQLSTCTGLNEHNNPGPGERILGFLTGTSQDPTLTLSLRVGADERIDPAPLSEAPSDLTADGVWRAIEARWTELGRPRD